MKNIHNDLAQAITSTLSSSNEVDSNMEPANIVDGLYTLARSLHKLSRNDADSLVGHIHELAESHTRLAGALDNLADAVRGQTQ